MPRKRMRTAQRSSTFRLSRFGSPGVMIATAVLLVLSLWLLAGLVEQVITGARQDRLLAVGQIELATIEAEVQRQATAVAVANSPAYVEEAARSQLGYANENDVVVLPSFPQVTPTASNPTPAPIPSPTTQPNWRGWTQAFFPPEAISTPVP